MADDVQEVIHVGEQPGHDKSNTRITEMIRINELDIKLSGPENYPEWSTDLETYFSLNDGTEEYTMWDIFKGDMRNPKDLLHGLRHGTRQID